MKQKIASTTNSAQLAKNVRNRPSLNPQIYRSSSSEPGTLEDVKRIAESGYRLAKKIADLVNIENKCFFYAQTDAAPTPAVQSLARNWSGMTPVILNSVEQGDSDFQRNGDSLKIQHLDFFLTQNVNTGSYLPSYRLIIFWDETNTSNNTTDLIEAAFMSTSLIIRMTKDWDEKASTKILHDEFWHPPPALYDNALSTVQTVGKTHHRISIPINRHTQFEADTTTIVTGALKFLLVTDASPNENFEWQSRIIFTDD